MNHNINLNKFGLEPLSFNEYTSIEGGNKLKKFWDGAKWVIEKAGIIDFFNDMYDGIKEGYNDARK
jgi:hypothetical protein